MTTLERISKTAALVSVAAIVCLEFAFHPDVTWPLRAAGAAALILGWIGARGGREWVHAAWVAGAILGPAFLRPLAGREGEVLEFVWMAGLSASLLRTASWSGWALGASSVLAGGWALTLSLAWPVLVGREIGFDLALLRDLGAINSWALRSAPHVVGWTLFVVWTHLLGLLWVDWAARRLAKTPDVPPLALHGFWAAATAASLVAIYQGTVDLSWLNTPFWADLMRATGTMLDANAFGMCAAIAAPLAYLAMGGHSPARASLVIVVLAVNLAGLWMSGSRTAAVCGALATAALLAAIWKTFGARVTRFVPLAAGASAVIVVALVAASAAIGPARRLAERPIEDASVLSNIFNRGAYGTTALRIVEDHPLIGVGIGSYHVIAPDYWRVSVDQVLRWDTAQNWWRHQAAELGLIGGLVPLIWSAVIAWQIVAWRTRPGEQALGLVVRGVLLALGVSSLFHMPTQTPVVLLAFFLLLGWLIVLHRGRQWLPDAFARGAWAAVTLLAVGYAAGQMVLATGEMAVAERATQTRREYITGTYPPEQLPGSTPFRWTKEEAHFLIPASSRWLVFEFWAHHPDIETRPVQVTLSTPCALVYEETLTDGSPVTIGMTLPGGTDTVDLRLRVSRTWQPAAQGGSGDARNLGVGVVTDFIGDPAEFRDGTHRVDVGACGQGS